MTPDQKFRTKERNNPVGFGMAKGLSSVVCSICLLASLGNPVPLLYFHETENLRFLLTTHSSACFTYCAHDGRIIPSTHIQGQLLHQLLRTLTC